MKHAEGPWWKREWAVVDSKGIRVAFVPSRYGDVGAKIRSANTDLLAAASDLAGALGSALDEAGGFCNCPRKDLEIGGLGHGADCWTAVARKALHKAGVL